MKTTAVLIAILLTIGQAISQTYQSRDSSLIANKDLRKAAIIIEQGKLVAGELTLQQRRVDLLEQSCSAKDSLIASQRNTISLKDRMIINYRAIDGANLSVIKLKDNAIIDLRKSLVSQKRRTWIASIAAAASVVVLLLK